METDTKPVAYRIGTAFFYGISSFMIIVANKVVLTTYKFPSYQVLGIGQMITGMLVLSIAKLLNYVTFPNPSADAFKKIWPLPLIYLGNLVCGLGGTKKLNLPMFTVLRRFSILFTMLAEYWILGVKNTKTTILTVVLMIGGAMVAGATDLSFDLIGYSLIFMNNVFTAANVVYTKQKLDTKDIGKYGLLFNNAFFMILPLAMLALYNDEFEKVWAFDQWNNVMFLMQFVLSCLLGFVLNYSIVMCTAYNSALSTTIIGVIKNLLVTYFGMFLGDYIFTWPNFLGLNISVLGSIIYTYITFTTKTPSAPLTAKPSNNQAQTV